MTGIQYSNLTTYLTDLLEYPLISAGSATPSSDVNFNNILPQIINDAEQRIYKDVDFLSTRTEDSTLPVTIASRNFTIPSEIIVVQGINLITPANDAANVGTRISLLRVSVDALNMLWPQEAVTSPPVQGEAYYAMLSNTQALLAPTPDQTYIGEVVGIFRPIAMSSTNTTTYLGTNFPDLFLAACMVFAEGYFQKNFAPTGSDPNAPPTWEAAYQVRLKSTMGEEARRKGLIPEPA